MPRKPGTVRPPGPSRSLVVIRKPPAGPPRPLPKLTREQWFSKGHPPSNPDPCKRGIKMNFSEREDRTTFVTELIAARLSYAEIAKAVADKYGITRKAAYIWLTRMNARAQESLCMVDDTTMMNMFNRLVLSLENSVKMCKASGDYKSAIAGELAMARVLGFDRGTFIAALQAAAKQSKSKPLETQEHTSRNLLASDMMEMQTKQLEAMLKDDTVRQVLDEGIVEDADDRLDEKPKTRRSGR